MSTYANFNTSEGNFLCSNTGWGDVLAWSEDVPVEEHEQLIHLCEHGWCQNLPLLTEQLAKARTEHRPTPDVEEILDTLEALLGANKDATALVVSNGIVFEDDKGT